MSLRDDIEKLAYELYEQSGRQEDRDQEHWFEAERILQERVNAEGAHKKADFEEETTAN
jgi:hypothetical protein